MSDIVQKDSIFYLTCSDYIGFEGPFHCLVKKVCQDKYGQRFYHVSIDPVLKLDGIAGRAAESYTEFVVCTRRIEENLEFDEGLDRVTLNVFSFLSPIPDSDMHIDIDFGRIYLLVTGVAHDTEANAREHLTHM